MQPTLSILSVQARVRGLFAERDSLSIWVHLASDLMSMGRQTPQNEAKSPSHPVSAEAVNLPPMGGELNMRIGRDGTWYYHGSPIRRHALVKLFSTVLRRDDDGVFWLTTPVQNGQIEVEDAPFLAVELMTVGEGPERTVRFRTDVDDIVTLDADHPLRVAESDDGEPRPYVMVRERLEARLVRSVFYDLVEMAEPDTSAPDILGVFSAGCFFPLGRSQ